VTCATFVLTNGFRENIIADQIQDTTSAAFAWSRNGNPHVVQMPR